jgi:hypothetical protein
MVRDSKLKFIYREESELKLEKEQQDKLSKNSTKSNLNRLIISECQQTFTSTKEY